MINLNAMRLVYFGSSYFGVPSLRAIKESQHELVHIFTQPARPAGRHKTPRPTPVSEWARENSIPCSEAENINSADQLAAVASCGGDLLVVIAFGQKISPEVIDLHPKGAINVHASLLPKYRGAAPINRAIMEGEKETGVSIITLADRMDAGYILSQAKIPVSSDDTAASLHDKMAKLSPSVLLETIDQISSGNAVYTQQDESLVTYAKKLKKSDGFIDWSEPADIIVDKIRGLWSWPGARSDYVCSKTSKCCRVTIARACAVAGTNSDSGAYGLLNEDLNVICGKNAVKILKIKPAGKGLMDFRDFANGRATQPRDLFMKIEER